MIFQYQCFQKVPSQISGIWPNSEFFCTGFLSAWGDNDRDFNTSGIFSPAAEHAATNGVARVKRIRMGHDEAKQSAAPVRDGVKTRYFVPETFHVHFNRLKVIRNLLCVLQ